MISDQSYQLDVADIQGNVLVGYNHPHVALVFARIDGHDRDGAIACLQGWVDGVTTAVPQDNVADVTLNLAFSHAGMQALGLDGRLLSSFPVSFTAGPGGSVHAAEWHAAEEDVASSAHLVALVHGRAGEPTRRRAFELTQQWPGSSAVVHGGPLPTQEGAARRNEVREPFGFRDGLSQPAIAGVPQRVRQGRSSLASRRADGGGPLAAGEFVLGYRDEEGVVASTPRPRQLAVNGTFLVYLKLSQNVARFEEHLAVLAEHWPGGGADALAAKLMGRFKDGAAIVPGSPRDAAHNDFDFGDDPQGFFCPIGSHIRRANPRDALTLAATNVRRHRLVRRGHPYWAEGDQGLLFMCYCADIARQFEFVRDHWLGDGDAFRLGRAKDIFAPGDRGSFSIQGPPPWTVSDLPEVVRQLDGQYFFQPGVSALRWLLDSARRMG